MAFALGSARCTFSFLFLYLVISYGNCTFPILLWSSQGSHSSMDLPTKNVLDSDVEANIFALLRTHYHKFNVFLTSNPEFLRLNFNLLRQNPVLNKLFDHFQNSSFHLLHWCYSPSSFASSLLGDSNGGIWDVSDLCQMEGNATSIKDGLINSSIVSVYKLPIEKSVEFGNGDTWNQHCNYALSDLELHLGNLLSVEGPILNVLVHNTLMFQDRPRSAIAKRALGDQPVLGVSNMHGLQDDGVFRNFKNCTYFYAKTMVLELADSRVELLLGSADISQSVCGRNTSSLSMIFSSVQSFNNVSILFLFTASKRGWKCAQINVTLVTNSVSRDYIYGCAAAHTNLNVSYTCYSVTFPEIATPTSPSPSSYLTLTYLQLQPFVDESFGEAFGVSDNCAPTVTVPLVMGFLVSLFSAIIIAVGIDNLAGIKGSNLITKRDTEYLDMGSTTR